MTFLNPAILIGAVAAVVPVLIHFLNLRKLERVEFSTLTFLKELQKSKIRKLKFKQLLLMILRILIILSLVFAFARPTAKTNAFTGTTSAAKVTAVLVIDDSPSMDLLGENGTNFNVMKKIAKEVLNNFQDGDGIFIVKLSDASIRKFTEISKARKFLKTIKLSACKGNFYAAVKKAKAVLLSSKDANKELYLISDFQRNIFSADVEDEKRAVLNSKIFYIPLKIPSVNNFAVSGLQLENKILRKDKKVSFSADVRFYGRNVTAGTVLSLFLNGKKESQFSLNGKNTGKVKFDVTLLKSGLIRTLLKASDDAFNYDNENYLCFKVPEVIRIAIIKKFGADTKFLKLALGSNVKGLVREYEFEQRQFNSVNLNDYNVIVIVGYSKELNFKRIQNYLNAGHGVIFIPAKNSTEEELAELCKGLQIPSFGKLIFGKNYESINAFAETDFSHPIFEGVFLKGKRPQIESPEFYGYFKFVISGEGRPIIKLADGSSFLSEFNKGKGKLLVFNVPFDLEFGNFPLKGFFAPLVNKTLFYLSSDVASIKSVLAGQTIAVDLSEALLQQLTVVRPDGSKEIVDLTGYNKNYFPFTQTNEIGIYKFYSGKKIIDFVSVNPVKSESVLKSLEQKSLQNKIAEVFPGSKILQVNEDAKIKNVVLRSRYGVELGKYFLILAIVFALAEMLVGKSSKKDLVEVKKND